MFCAPKHVLRFGLSSESRNGSNCVPFDIVLFRGQEQPLPSFGTTGLIDFTNNALSKN